MERRHKPDLCQLLFEQEAQASFDSYHSIQPYEAFTRFLERVRQKDIRPKNRRLKSPLLCPALVRHPPKRPYSRLSPSKPPRPVAFSFENSGVFREIDVGKSLVTTRLQIRSKTPFS